MSLEVPRLTLNRVTFLKLFYFRIGVAGEGEPASFARVDFRRNALMVVLSLPFKILSQFPGAIFFMTIWLSGCPRHGKT